MTDLLHRFVFEDSDIRGEIVSLSDSYGEVLANGRHGGAIDRLLGEMLAAVGLMSATLKFDGTLSLQARGDGELKLAVADCSHQRDLRAIAQVRQDNPSDTATFDELLGSGHLALTIDPARGQRHQGIVPLESATLAGCLEDYFRLSEQLPTRLWLAADGRRAAGLLLQGLPAKQQSEAERNQYWQHLATLAETLTAAEMLDCDNETLLHRLFHAERLRLFEPAPLQFGCSCSRQRTENMLKSLGADEVYAILEELGEVEVNCQFCHRQYRFDRADIDSLFPGGRGPLH